VTLRSKIELGSGLITLLAGAVATTIAFSTNYYTVRPSARIKDFLGVTLLWLGIPLLVAISSYAHAIKQQRWGFSVLTVCGLISAGYLALLYVAIGASWYYPMWLALVSASPSLGALTTFFIALSVPTK
jgi:hypothetical protein